MPSTPTGHPIFAFLYTNWIPQSSPMAEYKWVYAVRQDTQTSTYYLTCIAQHRAIEQCWKPSWTEPGAYHRAPNSEAVKNCFFPFWCYFASPWCQVLDDTHCTLAWDVVSALTRIEVCLRELNKWMLLNNFRLNNEKTELLVLHVEHRPKPPLDLITVGKATVEPTSSARNIGAIFDDTITFYEHVTELCRTSFFHIRNISGIRPCLSIDSTKTLVYVRLA